GLDPEAREQYHQAWTAFRQALELEPSGRDPKNALAAALRLRQKSSLIRVASTAELILELLDNGLHVAVSVAFVESLDALREELARDKVKTAAVFGGLGAEAREEQRLRFQRGEVPVVLFTVEEGISLHQGEHDETPRALVIHDLRWSAIQMAQVEGRCHRDGRFAPAYWTFADETIEERIATVVASRIEAMKAMVGDDVETVREITRLLTT
ncbi:MAG: ATP-dependent helicase, partial [Myxococcales bacterium]|nr:ATP-dependent helicase [Myxococcales bacterium]